jgi:hypothetical protein
MVAENAIEKIPPTGLADPKAAQAVDARINEILDQELKAAEIRGKRGAELGRLLLQVQEEELYEALGFENYTDWLKGKKEKFGLEYPWLYAYKTSAEQLLPYLTEETFDEIGITKARELAKMVKASGGVRPADDLVELAKNPETTLGDLRVAIATRTNAPQDPKGTWLDLGGFYATAVERKFFDRAFEIAKRVRGIPKDWPEWMQKKEVLMAMAQEFLSTYETSYTAPIEGKITKKDVA